MTARQFQPTQDDINRAQAILNQLVQLYGKLCQNGGSCVPEFDVTINSDADLRAYAVLAHSGHGEITQTHAGWAFKYRHKANPTAGVAPRDNFAAALKQRSGFWEIFAKVQGKG